MAYESYAADISADISEFEAVADNIDSLNLDSVWKGSASDKQISNLDTLKSAIDTQVSQMNSLASLLKKIDEYDQNKSKLSTYYEKRSELNTEAKNYQTNYEFYTDLINDTESKIRTLKSEINSELSGEVTTYTQQFSVIPKTEVVSTSDVFKQATTTMSKLDGAFELQNVVSTTAVSGGISSSALSGPNFNNMNAWVNNNPYSMSQLYGQCTWFAWGRFYEIYGYSPGFTGNGNQCVGQLLNAHSDKFYKSNTPVPGSVFSMGLNEEYGHVGIVVDVDYDNNTITIQDGNYNGQTDSFANAQRDWGTRTYSLSEFNNKRGGVVYANPITEGVMI